MRNVERHESEKVECKKVIERYAIHGKYWINNINITCDNRQQVK